ncbi:hypothetical protein NDU88_008157 [Pleurodeles waltl]|uniref:Uncharacterized protein n=1 Tax=Pleurodeles waltl TaxID=8319 RepID=A0AAV7QS08_PLEWA|nr:hypothetical protein NDU88_008157 [Pleurodeles waltl]
MRRSGPVLGAPGQRPTAVRPAVTLPPSLPLTSLCCRQKQKKRPENPPDLGSALGRGDPQRQENPKPGCEVASGEGAISGPGSWLGSCGNVEIVNEGGTQREPNKFVYFCKTLKGEPWLGTEKAGILRGAQKAVRNRTSSRSELTNPA